MTAPGRLSTCAVCGGTIRLTPEGWGHVSLPRTRLGHPAEPDDSAVSGPGEDDNPPHPPDAYLLRLHGNGDGSVSPYCRHCSQLIGILPRPATLDVINQAWVLHLEAHGG